MESKLMFFSFSTLLCLIKLMVPVDACNCLVNHPQRKFCQADFSVKVRILLRKKVEHPDTSRPSSYRFMIGYHVDVLDIFKGKDYIEDEKEIWIHTPDTGGLCGVSGLKTNQVYLVSGRYTRDLFYTTYCDLWANWTSLTVEQQEGVRHEYGNHCSICRIAGVMGIIFAGSQDLSRTAFLAKSPLWSNETCKYNPVASFYYKTHDCETMYSYCAFVDGTCSWQPSRMYSLCYKAREEMWRYRNTLKGLGANRRKPRRRCKGSTTRFIKPCRLAKRRRAQKRRLAQKLVAQATLTSLLRRSTTSSPGSNV